VNRTVLLLCFISAQPVAHAFETVKPQETAVDWVGYYARVYQVPEELVEAVIEVESGWNPYAVSPKGAVGLMQLMPGTAVRFGVWNRFRVQENIRGGVQYLAWLLRLFRGDLRMATAAYFAGESSIRFQDGELSTPEVYGYVSRVGQLYRAKRLVAARERQNNAK